MAATSRPKVKFDIDDAEKAAYDPLLRRDSSDGSELDRDYPSGPALRAMLWHERPRRRWLSIVVKMLALGGGILGLLALGRVSAPHTPGLDNWIAPRAACWCGTNTAEALALGCKYSEIGVAWLPAHCRDDELDEEFAHAGPGPDGTWDYYDEPNKQWRLNSTELSSRADTGLAFFATLEWHISHCTFNWRKQFRAREKGTTLEIAASSEGHIHHCLMIFKMRAPLQSLATISGVHINGDVRPKGAQGPVRQGELKVVPNDGHHHHGTHSQA